jgi:3-isopropylmalate/(R)-2-methylmalate dehydratase small subunit
MRDVITGRVWKFGDDVNTDVIFPGKYTYTITEPAEMARHAMEDADSSFAGHVQKDDIIVAGRNFGCGSSREQAALCLKAAGVGAVIAKSFARIYFRNAVNLGLPIVICPEVVGKVAPGDMLSISFSLGKLTHKGQEYRFPPLPEEVAGILDAGGLVPYVKAKFQKSD